MRLMYISAKVQVIKLFHNHETLSNNVNAGALCDNKVSISDKLLDTGENTAHTLNSVMRKLVVLSSCGYISE